MTSGVRSFIDGQFHQHRERAVIRTVDMDCVVGEVLVEWDVHTISLEVDTKWDLH